MRERVVTKTILLLAPILLGWSGLILLSHQTSEWAIGWTHRLFGWMILLTYVLLWGVAICLSSRPRNAFLRGITFTLTVGFILLCAEIPAMLKFVHWKLALQQLTGDFQQYTWAFRPDRELEFRRRPYDHWIGKPASDIESVWMMTPSIQKPLEFTYDRWGYRNTIDFEQADIALIGDSYVEGWYVSDEQTTARYLQTHLGRPVVNLGVAGYGTLQEFLVLKQDAVRFRPKVVIWFFFEGNDLYDDQRFENYLLKPFSEKETTASPKGFANEQGWTQQSFTLTLIRWLRRISASILPTHSPYFGRIVGPRKREQTVYFANYAAVPWDEWMRRRWKKTRDTLTQGAEFSRARGIRLLFVFVPTKFRVYQPFMRFDDDSPCLEWKVWPIDELFLTFCEAQNVPCLNLTTLFQEAVRDGRMPYAAVDSHWSPEGHSLVAQRLVTELRQRGWHSMSPTAR